MPDSQKKNENILETYIRVGILEERFERHNEDMIERTEKINSRHDKLDERINKLVDRYIHEHHEILEKIKNTEIKIASISSIIGAIISFVISYLSKKIG